MNRQREKEASIQEENGVTGSMVLLTIFLTILVFILTLPNIYLDNQIYAESRKIAHYQRIKQTLEEEQVLILEKLEKIHAQENLYND